MRPASLPLLFLTTLLLGLQTWSAWGGGKLRRLQGTQIGPRRHNGAAAPRRLPLSRLPQHLHGLVPPSIARRAGLRQASRNNLLRHGKTLGTLPRTRHIDIPQSIGGVLGHGRRLMRAKKGDVGGGGPAPGAATCTTVYLGGYHGGTADHNYVGYEFESGNDANETDPLMFDAIIEDMCTPLPQEDWLPFVIPGSESIIDTGITWKKMDGNPPQWETWELSDGRDVYSLPAIEDSCDDDTFEKGNSRCEQREFLWQCNVTDSAALQTELKRVQKVVADDCFTIPKCMGAPIGEIKCSFDPIPAGKFVEGMDMVVNGDRCAACSLGVDMEDGDEGELCPRYYDVHNCAFEWKLTDTMPEKHSAFEFTYTINASATLSSGMTWLAVAVLAVLSVMRG